MDGIIGKTTDCPFCGNTFYEGDAVAVFEEDGKLVIYCIGCGYDLEVEFRDDGKVYIK